MTRILVADDHDLVRMGIVRMLSDVDGYEVVADVQTGEDALALTRTLKPDVVLMDVKMPGIGGLEATKKMCASHPEVKIIAVTACDDSLHPTKLMQAGAVGYVTKGAGFGEITDAIEQVIGGRRYMSHSVAQQLAARAYNEGRHEETPFEKLSQRELQTAMMIATGQRAAAIADTFKVSPKTVNSYRYRIFEKLDIHSDVELTLLAVKHNFLDPESVV